MPTEPTYYGEMRGHMTQETPTDALVKRSQSGDREAFGQLVDRYRSRLEKQVEARMGQGVKYKLEAGDIVQETFTGAFKSIGKFQNRGGDSFYRWLGSIAEHLIWNAAQKKDWSRLETGHDLPENGVPPSKNLRRDERFDRLESALSDWQTAKNQSVTGRPGRSRINGFVRGWRFAYLPSATKSPD